MPQFILEILSERKDYKYKKRSLVTKLPLKFFQSSIVSHAPSFILFNRQRFSNGYIPHVHEQVEFTAHFDWLLKRGITVAIHQRAKEQSLHAMFLSTDQWNFWKQGIHLCGK